MRKLHTLAAALTIASVGATGAAAQGKGNSGAPKAPKAPTVTVSHGNSGATHGSGPAKGTGAPASGSQASTSTGSGHGGGAGKGANAGKGNGKTTTVTASVTTGSGSTTTTTTTTTPPPAPPNALSMKLSKNPGQLARLKGMLPEGMTIEQATTGFRNQGQFIAALNASRNQGVSFADLQTAMTVDGLSLGQAVKQLRNAPPDAPEAPATGGTTTGGTTTGGTSTGS